MFADRAKIVIRSGKGGDGHVSFRRELFVPNGGPDGGDGGRGGDVIFEVDEGLNTLNEFRHKRKYAAQNGEQGGKKRCHGADGKDITLRVPEGTVVYEAESGKVIADMSGENRRQVILKGGRGGKGNMHYATATMQVPKYAQPGQPAQELEVRLELKVIADVGLVGYPNVGKSTFINSLAGKTAAKTGNKPGVTRGNQWIKIDKQLELLDTPGILWPKFDDEAIGMKLACVGSISDEVLNMQEIAYHLLSYGKANYNQLFEARYGAVPQPDDERDNEIVLWMENIARQRGCLKRGAETDFDKVSAQITDDFRSGRIGKVSLEVPKQA